MRLNTIPIGVLLLVGLMTACRSDPKPEKQKEETKIESKDLSFADINGVQFFEVKRRFKNNLSFNEDGFQQEPKWLIQFKAPDTMLAYSPEKGGMEAFYLQHDHGKVYNFAREFFRAKVIHKDSLILQRLQVTGRVIAGDDDVRSDVYCVYYSKDYIENKLKTTVEELRKPTKADTVFIKKLTDRSNLDPGNPKLAFAARTPVSFIPKGEFITAEKQSTQNLTDNRTAAYDYIYPEYKIVILRAYKAFAYRVHFVVDANGKMYVTSVEGVMPEYQEARKKMLQGVADVYFKNMLKINPGTTLGIPHSSTITINIVGKLAK